MCDPVTLSIGATVMSTAIGAVGQAQQASAANAAAKYQANVAAMNAQQARQLAADARQRGAIEADENREKTSRLIGRQRTIAGAAGLNLDGGTPLDVFQETAETGEYDSQKILANAERAAYGHENNAVNFDNSADLARSRKVNPTLGIVGTVLGGVASTAGKWHGISRG